MPSKEEFDRQWARLNERTLTPISLIEKQAVDNLLDCEIASIGYLLAARDNLNEAISLCTTIWVTSVTLESEKLYDRLLAAHRIRFLQRDTLVKSIALNESREVYEEKLGSEMQQHFKIHDVVAEFQKLLDASRPADPNEYWFFSTVVEKANHMLDDPAVFEKNSLMMRQGIVLLWTTWEVFLQNLIEDEINRNFSIFQRINSDQEFSKQYGLSNISIDLASRFEFDMRNKMGTFLVERLNLSDFSVSQKLLGAILGKSSNILAEIKAGPLYGLSKKRNLIVHKGGVVDLMFLRQVKSDLSIGQLIQITPEEFRLATEHLWVVARKLTQAIKKISIND